MKSIYGTFLKVFPMISWYYLNYTSYPRIRFYFDDKKRSLMEAGELSTKIIKDTLNNEEIYIGVTFFRNKLEMEEELKKIQNEGLGFIIQDAEKKELISNIGSEANIFYFKKINSEFIATINSIIVKGDINIDIYKIQLKCYYFSPKKGILINPYGSDGMDIISNDIRILNKIKNQWSHIVSIQNEHD